MKCKFIFNIIHFNLENLSLHYVDVYGFVDCAKRNCVLRGRIAMKSQAFSLFPRKQYAYYHEIMFDDRNKFQLMTE